jgi:hypothetical protein
VWRGISIDFASLFPTVDLDVYDEGSYEPQELMLLDCGVVLKWMEEQKNKKNELGFFDDSLSSSFVERMNSALELVMGNGRALLPPKELSVLAVLRINRICMEHMEERRAVRQRGAGGGKGETEGQAPGTKP